jgi:flagellar export protein FliJ
MTAFRFRLERALEWYRNRCTAEENRLTACLASRQTVQESLARTRAEREGVDREMIARDSIAARDLAALGLYRLRIKQRIAQLEEDLAGRERAVSDQRKKVQLARRSVHLVEKLRERRLAEHVYEESRETENLAAESFSVKWCKGEESKCRRQWQS